MTVLSGGGTGVQGSGPSNGPAKIRVNRCMLRGGGSDERWW